MKIPLLLRIVLKALFFTSILAVAAGLLWNYASNSILWKSIIIAMVYAWSATFVVIVPLLRFLHSQKIKSEINRYFIFTALLIVLSGLATITAEAFIISVIYKTEFVLLGKGNMYVVNFILSSFSVYVLHTLNRPLDEQKKKEKISKDYISLRMGKKIRLLKFDEIDYISTQEKHIFIYSKSGKLFSDKSLQQLTSELPDNFIQISRSCILNKKKVKEIRKTDKGDFLFLLNNDSGANLKSGITYKDAVKEAFQI